MKKVVTFIIAIMLAICLLGSAFASKIRKYSDWALYSYVDDFKEDTGELYIANQNKIKGTFNSSFSTNETAYITILIDMDSSSLILYKYNTNDREKNPYSYDIKYTISVKSTQGTYKTSGVMYPNNNRITIKNPADFNKILRNNSSVDIYIEETQSPLNSYLFKNISTAGFADAENAMCNGVSGIADYVTRCYNIILQRSPDASGLNYWANALLNGSKAAANIIDDFVNSQEFKSRNLSNAEKVKILYMTMLNRAPDTAGLSYWVNNLNQGQPLAAIINGFCNAPEFINICNSYGIKPGSVTVPDAQPTEKRAKIEAFVTRCYSIILGRQPDAAGLNHWANSLESGAQAASNIIDDFINSAEFRNRRLSNAATIEILYKTMLNRAPDAAGIAYWESLLNQGQPFAVIINGFCGSPEFIAICNEYGIKPGSVAVKGASEYVTPEQEEVPIAEAPVVPEEAPVAGEQPTTEDPVIEEPPAEPAAVEEPVVEQPADPITEEEPVVGEQPVPENSDPAVDAEPTADAEPAAEEQPGAEAEPVEAQPASDNTEPVVEEAVIE